MSVSLLRGRLQVRILPGSPEPIEKYKFLARCCAGAFGAIHVFLGRICRKNVESRTKPVQNLHVCASFGAVQ